MRGVHGVVHEGGVGAARSSPGRFAAFWCPYGAPIRNERGESAPGADTHPHRPSITPASFVTVLQLRIVMSWYSDSATIRDSLLPDAFAASREK